MWKDKGRAGESIVIRKDVRQRWHPTLGPFNELTDATYPQCDIERRPVCYAQWGTDVEEPARYRFYQLQSS
jgi:hypothetical protein